MFEKAIRLDIALLIVLYFHSPAARENTAAHSCNIQPCSLLTHQIIYMYQVPTTEQVSTPLFLPKLLHRVNYNKDSPMTRYGC